MKQGSSPFSSLTMPPPRARTDWLSRCVWNRVAKLLGDIQRTQARKGAGPGGGEGCSLLRQPQDWSVAGICMCIVTNGRAQDGRGPAPSSQRRPRAAQSPRRVPFRGLRAVRWRWPQRRPRVQPIDGRVAGALGPAPRRAGLGRPDWCSGRDRREAVRAEGAPGRASRGCRPCRTGLQRMELRKKLKKR